MNPTAWIVQTNLGNAQTSADIEAACRKHGYEFHGITVVPFSDDVPDLDGRPASAGPVLVYGATGFVTRVIQSGRWLPGAFWQSENFTAMECVRQWGEQMLNDDAVFLRGADLTTALHPDRLYFLRPNDDLKGFSGRCETGRQIVEWIGQCAEAGCPMDDRIIAVSAPKVIDAEWRLFVTGEQVPATASEYKTRGRQVSEGCPGEVAAFARACIDQWMPAPCFALDICVTEGELRIVELTSVNSAGFYAASAEKIVVSASMAAEASFRAMAAPQK